MSNTNNLLKDLQALENYKKHGPSPDLGTCCECGKTYNLSELETEPEGDWETGYYDVVLCPICPNGGYIDYYDYSDEQRKLYEEWRREKASF